MPLFQSPHAVTIITASDGSVCLPEELALLVIRLHDSGRVEAQTAEGCAVALHLEAFRVADEEATDLVLRVVPLQGAAER